MSRGRSLVSTLLRALVFCISLYLIWSSLSHSSISKLWTGHGNSSSSRPDHARGNALVVASLKGDDVSWLEEVLPGWERNIYVADEPVGQLSIPKNKGRESMIYLSFIIDNYEHLPDVTVFIHSLRYQWHNDDPIYDGIPILQNFHISGVYDQGYANLRCCWTLGCPVEIRPTQNSDPERTTELHYADAFQELFPGQAVPEAVGVACCAQFAVTRAKIMERPVDDYIRYRKWLLETPLEDSVSGRILEYSWHIIFGKPAIHCPLAEECYCKTFGYCNLNCTQGTCDDRYILPPYSTIPEGWPEKGWS